MSAYTKQLAESPLFQTFSGGLPHNERIQLAYKRAIAIGKAYDLSIDDIVNTSPKFWELQADPILPMDGSAASLLSLHLNLCVGTLARQASTSVYLQSLLKKMLNFEIIGQFCLTEQAHGLDARNLETTATLLTDGTIDLHTPSDGGAKHMPPTSPCGIPTVAVVFARFLVNGEDRGVRPFIVEIHDGYTMNAGITSRLLTSRGSSVPLDHCLTYFDHVILPTTDALLSSPDTSKHHRGQFFDNIYRIIVGTMSIAGMALSSMKMGVYVAGCYSQRRKVTDSFSGNLTPIISFPTQQYPILSTLAQAIVFESLNKKAVGMFCDRTKNLSTRHCIAAIAKATLVKHCCASLNALGDRCGAQGIFEVNQFSVQYADMRGASIAEGDILGISIRFGIELLIQRIELPESSNPDSLLSRREASMFQELRDLASQFKHHRDPRLQSFILPRCQSLIEAIGYRIAYDAALEDGVDKAVLDMFLASVMREDRAWFSEVGRITRAEQMDFEIRAMGALMPQLDVLLTALDVKPYCTAPILSEERWSKYVQSLSTFTSADLPRAMPAPQKTPSFSPARAML